MDTKTPRPWYKKKRYIIPAIGIASIIGLSNISSSPATQVIQDTTVAAPQKQVITPVTTNAVQQKTVTRDQSSSLSNDNHYTNVDGNSVHSPAYSNSVPAGASAQCRDGSYSFSQHRQGTCSHHGGVAEWL